VKPGVFLFLGLGAPVPAGLRAGAVPVGSEKTAPPETQIGRAPEPAAGRPALVEQPRTFHLGALAFVVSRSASRPLSVNNGGVVDTCGV